MLQKTHPNIQLITTFVNFTKIEIYSDVNKTCRSSVQRRDWLFFYTRILVTKILKSWVENSHYKLLLLVISFDHSWQLLGFWPLKVFKALATLKLLATHSATHQPAHSATPNLQLSWVWRILRSLFIPPVHPSTHPHIEFFFPMQNLEFIQNHQISFSYGPNGKLSAALLLRGVKLKFLNHQFSFSAGLII